MESAGGKPMSAPYIHMISTILAPSNPGADDAEVAKTEVELTNDLASSLRTYLPVG